MTFLAAPKNTPKQLNSDSCRSKAGREKENLLKLGQEKSAQFFLSIPRGEQVDKI